MMRKKEMISEQILDFYESLNPDFLLPEGIKMMNPYVERDTLEIARQFYHRYYDDSRPRVLLFGINPGRFGAGVTGIPFTDPIRLETKCGIENNLDKKPELSSEFVYEMIDGYGGVKKFYDDVFVTAICPLGFTLDGKNLNYYDDKDLQKNAEPFIVETIWRQKEITYSPEVCFSLGKGKNFTYFQRLNKKYHFFETIIPLPHPRWVMQYRRKKKDYFIEEYVKSLHLTGIREQ